MLKCTLLVSIAAAVLSSQVAVAQSDATDWNLAAAKVAERLALVRGERVLLVGIPGEADPLVPALRSAIRDAGAIDLGATADRGTPPASWATDFTKRLASASGPAFDELLRTVDAAVMLPGATVTDRTYSGMQAVLRSGHGRTVHFHWSGAYDESSNPLPLTPSVSRFYLKALTETDYDALAARQRAVEAAMRNRTIRVTTPAGTDIRFRIGDRPVTKQDGDASAARARLARNLIDREVELPAGAIRVAPVEETVEGSIAFPPSMWAGSKVEGLVMTFAKGRVTGIRATVGRDAVERELRTAGNAGRAFREFALGLNPLLAMPAGEPRWIPYYGYGAGVVRLSLGDNTELGGAVGGGYVRWNFFTDATVIVGADTLVRSGVLKR